VILGWRRKEKKKKKVNFEDPKREKKKCTVLGNNLFKRINLFGD
jgi:hypothetical protein